MDKMREAFEEEMHKCSLDTEWSEENGYYVCLKVQSFWSVLNRVNAALAQQGEQEPVGVVVSPPEDSDCNTAGLYASGLSLPAGTELYTRPRPAIPECITNDMVLEGISALNALTKEPDWSVVVREVFRAMLAAAPKVEG